MDKCCEKITDNQQNTDGKHGVNCGNPLKKETLKLEGAIQALKMKIKFQCIKDRDIHPGQLMILNHMMNLGGCTQKTLAAAMHSSPASIGVSVKRLQKAGLLKKTQVDEDLRCTYVELTGRGEEIALKSIKLLNEMTNQMLDGFTDEEVENLHGYMKRIKINLENYQEELTKEGGV